MPSKSNLKKSVSVCRRGARICHARLSPFGRRGGAPASSRGASGNEFIEKKSIPSHVEFLGVSAPIKKLPPHPLRFSRIRVKIAFAVHGFREIVPKFGWNFYSDEHRGVDREHGNQGARWLRQRACRPGSPAFKRLFVEPADAKNNHDAGNGRGVHPECENPFSPACRSLRLQRRRRPPQRLPT